MHIIDKLFICLSSELILYVQRKPPCPSDPGHEEWGAPLQSSLSPLAGCFSWQLGLSFLLFPRKHPFSPTF